jgi:hypothetical protein
MPHTNNASALRGEAGEKENMEGLLVFLNISSVK